jgi:hypothetical protein
VEQVSSSAHAVTALLQQWRLVLVVQARDPALKYACSNSSTTGQQYAVTVASELQWPAVYGFSTCVSMQLRLAGTALSLSSGMRKQQQSSILFTDQKHTPLTAASADLAVFLLVLPQVWRELCQQLQYRPVRPACPTGLQQQRATLLRPLFAAGMCFSTAGLQHWYRTPSLLS